GTHLLFIHSWFGETAYSLCSVWWSMSLEWQYYLIFPLLLGFLRKSRPAAFFGTVAAASLLYRWSVIQVFPESGQLLWGVFAGRMTEFAAGMLLAFLIPYATAGNAPRVARKLFAGASALALAALLTRHPVFTELGRQSAVFAVFLGFLMRVPAAPRTALGRGLAFLGETSYSTYLIHTVAGKALLAVLAAAGLQALHPVSITFFFAAYFLVAHAAGIACFLLVERPATRLLTARAKRPVAAAPLPVA
ncbi:MAG: acyltransferase family protein, partial [Oligoflexia bacterium]|nr:acyltransferase family protein [Oligoflexia bacterium]